MRVIGFHGRKYSGKDTAAQPLIEDGWVRLAFADPLRAMLYDLNPIVHTDSYGRVFRWQEVWDTEGYDVLKKLPEARRLMQVFGTEVIRARDPDFFVRFAERTMLEHSEHNYVITDVRFDNEALMVRRYGDVVALWRDTDEYDKHGADHVSEAGISAGLVDMTLYNTGTVADLHELVRGVVGVRHG